MVRKDSTAHLVRCLTSRSAVLRTRAETLLYHRGPDAGDALFAAAEYVSHRFAIRAALLGILGTVAGVCLFFAALTLFAGRDTTAFWFPAAITVLLRAIWDIAADQVSRRERLKIVALALAKRNDLRAIGPLLEAWRPVSLLGRPLHDDDIEHELTRLLPLFLKQRSMDLRSYKKRHLRRKTNRLFPYRQLQRHVAVRAALSDSRADTVVTVLQLLARSTSDRDRALLERVSRLAAKSPNEVFIRDAAAVCLQRHTTTAPVAVETATVSASHTLSQPSAPSRVLLGRK